MPIAERVENLEDVRREAVAAALNNAPIEDERPKARNSQYQRLLDLITQDALRYAEQERMDVDEFRRGRGRDDSPLSSAIEVVSGLRMALVPSNNWTGDIASLNFWVHDSRAFERVQSKKTPYMHRAELEEVVGTYLELPFRCPAIDALLVDVLVALEMYGFAEEMPNEQTFGLLPARSPFKQRHAFLSYLTGLAICGFVLLGLAALCIFAGVRGWIGNGWAMGIAGVFGVLFLALLGWETFALPFAWRAQWKHKHKVGELMQAMFGLYPELDSSGPISAVRIRDRATDIAELGVIWPAPLFALLDDVIRRTGRL